MEDNANTFLKRLFGFSVGPFISAFLGFIMTPITTWLIVPEEFGKAAMYTTALSFASLAMFLGMDQAFVRDFNATKDKNSLLWNYILPPFVFSILLALILLIFGETLSHLLFADHEKFVINVLALSIPLAVFQRFNLLQIRMQEKAKLYSLITVLVKIIDLPLLIIFLLFFERSFRSIVLASFFTSLIITIILFVKNKAFWVSKVNINQQNIKQGLSYGLPLVPASIFAWGLYSIDNIALRAWSDFNQLGLFGAAIKLTMFIKLLNTSFSTFWSPTKYRWYESGVPNQKFITVSHYLSTILFIMFGLVVIFKDVIILIFDQSYHEAVNIVPFLLFFSMLYLISETTKIGIYFSRKTVYNMVATGVAFLINFGGNYFLVPAMGGLGASISTAIAFMFYFWINTLISRRLWFQFSLNYYIINFSLIIALACVSVFYHNTVIEIFIYGLIVLYNFSHFKALMIHGISQLREMRLHK